MAVTLVRTHEIGLKVRLVMTERLLRLSGHIALVFASKFGLVFLES